MDEPTDVQRGLMLPAAQLLEGDGAVLVHIGYRANEAHAVRCGARERQSRVGQQLEVGVRVGHHPSSWGASTSRHFPCLRF